MDAFDQLWLKARPAFAQERLWRRARTLALAALVALGRRTVTGLLTASAQHDRDWSAAYRLFSRERFDADALWRVPLAGVLERLDPQSPLVTLLDDTHLRRRGRKIHGAHWRRDPLGPAFRVNLIWAQRFLQLSAALPEAPHGPCRARAIPIDLRHAPPAPKPPKKATAPESKAWRARHRHLGLPQQAAARLAALRQWLDQSGQPQRRLLAAADGGFTNATMLKALPERVDLVGRVRKDAVLFAPPAPTSGSQRGRRRCYGAHLPTPEQLRQDEAIPWQSVRVWAAGEERQFQVKTLGPVRWRGAGARDLRLIVVRPLAYRPSQHAKLLYRDPAYLLTTAVSEDLAQVLQAFVWRGQLEHNFRDEKTLLGVGQAQVRTARATTAVPTLLVAAYALLLLAGQQVDPEGLARTNWQRPRAGARVSTSQLQGELRAQLWGRAMGVENLTDFACDRHDRTKSVKIENALFPAVYFAHG